MANGNIWATSTDADQVLQQVINTATWDRQMKMQRASQVRQVLESANPAEFMSYKMQDEQVKAYDNMQQQIINVAKKRNGRFSDQDILDINFMVNRFEQWQNKQLAVQNAFQKDYGIFSTHPEEFDPIEGMATIQNYLQTGEYMPGDMLKLNPINPVEYFQNVRFQGRTQPIKSYENTIIDPETGAQKVVTRNQWATQEEKEQRVLMDYMTNPRLQEGFKVFWDEQLSLSEKQLWSDQLDKHNSDPNNNASIKNPELFMGMKMFSGLIMKDTYGEKAYKLSERDVKKPVLTEIQGGIPQNLKRQVLVDNELLDADYGDHKAYNVRNFKTGKDFVFDDKTFVSESADDIGYYGKRADKIDVEKTGKSYQGVAAKVQEMFVYDDIPIYMGEDGKEFKNGWTYVKGQNILGKDKVRKKTFTLDKWQPLSNQHLQGIRDTFESEEEYENWLDENTEDMPIAVMPLSGSQEATRILDKPLVDFMEIANPEIVLGKVLSDSTKKEKESSLPELPTLKKWGEYKE